MCNFYNTNACGGYSNYGCSAYTTANTYTGCGTQMMCRDCNGTIWVRRTENNNCCSCCHNHCCNNGCNQNGNGGSANTNDGVTGNNGNGNFGCVTVCGYGLNSFTQNTSTTNTTNTGCGYSCRNRCSRCGGSWF